MVKVERSTILGPDGLPIIKAQLSKEHATPTLAGVRRVHEERVATNLTPERLGRILRDASEGRARDYLTLAEEMEERYLHYASQLQTRRLAIESVDITVEANKDVPSRITEAVKELVDESIFASALSDLTDGISKGLGVVEMMWEYERRTLRPVEYVYRDPRFFQFDNLTLSHLRLAVDGSIEGEDLPQAKYLRHLPRTKAGIPYRRGLARPAAWAFMIQSFSLQDWAGFSEVYGMPLRVGKYNANASPEDKRTLLKAVASIANDAAAIIPDGMTIDFHQVAGQHGEAVFSGLLNYCDKQVSKLVVGQTMTSDDGASLGQAKIHNEVRLDILRADCVQLAQTASRDLVKPFVDMNFGVQEHYPQVKMPVPDPEDIKALTEGVTSLVAFGLRVSEREMREKLGLSEPAADELLLVAPEKLGAEPKSDAQKPTPLHALSALSGQVQSCSCAHCLATLAAQEIPDNGAGDVMRLFDDQEWEEVTKPLLGPLDAILDQATSLEEALAMLDQSGPDGEKLVEQLTKLMAISRGIGDVKD